MYNEVHQVKINNLKYASKFAWLRESWHNSGRTFASLENGSNHHSGYLLSTKRCPLWAPRVRRTPTRFPGIAGTVAPA